MDFSSRTTSTAPSIAVFLPKIGLLSETFNRKYCYELEEGGSLTLGRTFVEGGWSGPEGKTFLVNNTTSGFPVDRLKEKVMRKLKVPALWTDSRGFCQVLEKILREHETSALFSQYLSTGLHLDRVCKSAGLRHVVRGHGYDITQMPKTPWGQKYCPKLSQFDHILVPTPFQADILMDMGVPSAMISCFPCCVDIPPLKLLAKSSDGVLRCLSVGRMVPKKAPLKTMEAFFEAASRYDALELIMVGDGPLYEQCLDLKNDSKFGHRVHLIGRRSNDEVRELMSNSHIFLQHSIVDPESGDQEGAPVAILEAMAYGLPVVSTKHSGIPFQVEEGKTGYLVEEGDIYAMGESIVALAHDEKQRQEFGRRGFERVRDQFNWDNEKAIVRNLCINY